MYSELNAHRKFIYLSVYQNASLPVSSFVSLFLFVCFCFVLLRTRRFYRISFSFAMPKILEKKIINRMGLDEKPQKLKSPNIPLNRRQK